jgi:hypothetical protein
VAAAVAEPWFAEAMSAAADVGAVVVLAHMDIKDPLKDVILAAIRGAMPHKPVQFLSGHSHYRAWQVPWDAGTCRH